MDWVASDALTSLRSILNDLPTDKWAFKENVFPTPDSVTTRFFVGNVNVVAGSLKVYHKAVLVTPNGTPLWKTGEFDLIPAVSGEVQTSHYYQWFTDEVLAVCLDDAAQMLSFYETVIGGFAAIIAAGDPDVSISVDIPAGVRPGLLQYAAANAYMRKAAETADSLQAGAPLGYSLDTTKRHPNWSSLAKMATEAGKAKLETYTDNPLSANRVRMAWVGYRLHPYQGP